MTQIRSFTSTRKKPGELGVHSLDSLAMEAPDLVVAEQFHGAFGLKVEPKVESLGLRTKGYTSARTCPP